MEAFSMLLALCVGSSPVPVNSPHRGQWRGPLMFSLICAGIKDWVNNREAGDLRRHRGHYDVNVMNKNVLLTLTSMCLYIYMHIDPYVLYIYIYAYVYVLFWFYLIDFIIYVRDEHEALHCILANSIVPKCCTVTCFLAPFFDNYLLWNRD